MNKIYKKSKIAIVGLGYVGLPVAIEFAKKRDVAGFDLNRKRVNSLNSGYDINLETSEKELKLSKNLIFTNKISDIRDCRIFIVTVPTPIDNNKKPDLKMLKNASKSLGKIIKKNDIVIYESTVYPGVTEEICVPLLEKNSGLKFNKDFFCGYSPERINPGDKKHRLSSIKKVTSGSNARIATIVDELYNEIIVAGTHKAPSIKVAEAAKIIENTQRDVNIALVNEFAMIFKKLEIDTKSVLDAAGTKWNFLPFKPGLVGGHCIGVDPYYLAHKALKVGHKPEMILAGRKINDNMSFYIVKKVKEKMSKRKINFAGANVLIMGITFKENCPDIRNTKVFDVVNKFKQLKMNVDVYDPWANKNEVLKEYNLKLINKPIKAKYNLILLAVNHKEFKKITYKKIKTYTKDKHVIFDLQNILDKDIIDASL
tara:strand:+ start:1187 stop:2467 length:1281 start_codon:yes stop_codon:yes gene_type:complete